MVQEVTGSHSKHKDLSSRLRTHIKSQAQWQTLAVQC